MKPKVLCIATKCKDVAEFIAKFHVFVDDTSLFIATSAIRDVGSEAPIAVTLADRTPVLRGWCKVVESYNDAANSFGRPGFRVVLDRLTQPSEDVFAQLKAARASGKAARMQSQPIKVMTAPQPSPTPTLLGLPTIRPPHRLDAASTSEIPTLDATPRPIADDPFVAVEPKKPAIAVPATIKPVAKRPTVRAGTEVKGSAAPDPAIPEPVTIEPRHTAPRGDETTKGMPQLARKPAAEPIAPVKLPGVAPTTPVRADATAPRVSPSARLAPTAIANVVRSSVAMPVIKDVKPAEPSSDASWALPGDATEPMAIPAFAVTRDLGKAEAFASDASNVVTQVAKQAARASAEQLLAEAAAEPARGKPPGPPPSAKPVVAAKPADKPVAVKPVVAETLVLAPKPVADTLVLAPKPADAAPKPASSQAAISTLFDRPAAAPEVAKPVVVFAAAKPASKPADPPAPVAAAKPAEKPVAVFAAAKRAAAVAAPPVEQRVAAQPAPVTAEQPAAAAPPAPMPPMLVQPLAEQRPPIVFAEATPRPQPAPTAPDVEPTALAPAPSRTRSVRLADGSAPHPTLEVPLPIYGNGLERMPGSEIVLPANPFFDLSDASLEGIVECRLFEAPAHYPARDEVARPRTATARQVALDALVGRTTTARQVALPPEVAVVVDTPHRPLRVTSEQLPVMPRTMTPQPPLAMPRTMTPEPPLAIPRTMTPQPIPTIPRTMTDPFAMPRTMTPQPALDAPPQEALPPPLAIAAINWTRVALVAALTLVVGFSASYALATYLRAPAAASSTR